MDKKLLIIHLYPHTRAKAIALLTGFSVAYINNIASTAGLKKSESMKDYQKQKRIQLLNAKSEDTRFKPGHISHNKGVRMNPEHYAKILPTMFRKGREPHNTKSDGAVSFRRDKTGREYAWIRIRMGHWELLHRHIWALNNGPIPQGHVVIFRSNNTRDCSIENLELITMEENMLRNNLHNKYPKDLVAAIQAKAALTRRINTLQH